MVTLPAMPVVKNVYRGGPGCGSTGVSLVYRGGTQKPSQPSKSLRFAICPLGWRSWTARPCLPHNEIAAQICRQAGLVKRPGATKGVHDGLEVLIPIVYSGCPGNSARGPTTQMYCQTASLKAS